MDMASQIEKYRISSEDSIYKVALLEPRVKEREEKVQTVLKTKNEPRVSSILGSALEFEYAAHAGETMVGKALIDIISIL
ncbi:hypothetical protein CRYUN_Cryun04dG0113500 [Craigia yunnanensis]